jgi:hypothetical protein
LRWEALNSVPPAPAGALHSDPRCLKEQERLNMAVKHAPQIAAVHYEDADSPTECQFAMALSFCSQIFESQLHIPSYMDWFQHRADYLPALRFHKQLLQLLQAHNTGRWTLKRASARLDPALPPEAARGQWIPQDPARIDTH